MWPIFIYHTGLTKSATLDYSYSDYDYASGKSMSETCVVSWYTTAQMNHVIPTCHGGLGLPVKYHTIQMLQMY